VIIRKPLDLPRDVGLKFLDLMRAYYAAPDPLRADAIASEALHVLRQHYSGRLKTPHVKELFALARDAFGAALPSPAPRPKSAHRTRRKAKKETKS